MFAFDKHWADEIAEITGRAEFQTLTIEIREPTDYDPDLYDIVTGVDGNEPASLLYGGQARLIGVRWGVTRAGGAQANGMTEKSIRIQIPKDAVGRVDDGAFVKVTAAPKNPTLVNRIFAVTSDIQGGSSATRTIECSADSDSVAA